MIINLFLRIGHSRMGRRTHENFQRSTSQAYNSIGKFKNTGTHIVKGTSQLYRYLANGWINFFEVYKF